MPDTSRPLQHLADLMRRYPDLPAQVDHLRAGRGHDLPDWPADEVEAHWRLVDREMAEKGYLVDNNHKANRG